LHLRRDLAKPVIIAVSLVLVISFVAVYILPQYVYISPFSAIYANGIVDHKKIGHGTDNGVPFTNYVINIHLLNDDPVNSVKSGNILGYIVSQDDWNKVEWGDTVKIKIHPNAKAEIANLYPSLEPAAWRDINLDGLTIDLETDKPAYSPTETVNFTLNIKNDKPIDNFNKSLSIFDSFDFWVYDTQGNQICSIQKGNSNMQEIFLTENQEASYNFQWSLTNIPDGYYSVRVFVGYLAGNEEAALTGTEMVRIN
jgi:hypothetical protein